MKFNYSARTNDGAAKEGEIRATNESEAVNILQSQGLIITDLVSLEAEQKKEAFNIPFLPPVRSRTLVVFTRQLATLIAASVPIVQALESLARQQENKFFQERIEWMARDISGGLPISQAFAKYPKIFNKFFVAMVQVGEATGNIAKTFTYLANYIEKEHEIKSKIKGALMYPAVVLVAFLIIGVVMMIYVLPQLTAMFREVDRELPILTKIIIQIADFSENYWYVLLLLVFVFPVVLMYFLLATKNGRKIWDVYSLRIPGFGPLIKKIYLARFSESMSTLINGGLPMLETIQVTQSVMTNQVYKDILSHLLDEVRAGKSMSETLEKEPNYFPAMVTQLIKVGESTGKTSDTLSTTARFFQLEVENVLANLTTLIEPVMLLILGFIVGGLVIGILMPIYDFSANGL